MRGDNNDIYYHYYQFTTNRATCDGTFGCSNAVSFHLTKKLLLFMLNCARCQVGPGGVGMQSGFTCGGSNKWLND